MARGGLFIVAWGFVRVQPGYLQSDVRPCRDDALSRDRHVMTLRKGQAPTAHENQVANNWLRTNKTWPITGKYDMSQIWGPKGHLEMGYKPVVV